ncbi:MAG: hypothetical protein ACREOI_22640 [bacterium]
MAKPKSYEDYIEDSPVREVHRIREQLDREQKESGLSYFEWIEATDKDLRQSLAEVGFEIVTRDGRTFLDEIKPRRQKGNSKSQALAAKERLAAPTSLSSQVKTAKHKNYDDYLEDLTRREMHLIREDRAFTNKTATQPKKKHVKYKTAIKRNKTTTRKKSTS